MNEQGSVSFPDVSTAAALDPASAAFEPIPADVRALLVQQTREQRQALQVSPRTRAFVRRVDRGVLSIARHWVLAVNVIGGLYAGLPLLGPWLLSKGATFPAQVIYFAYSLTCHQLPNRSFYIFGQKMCYCQRCMSIYSGIFLLGLLFPLVSGRIRPLRWRWMFLLWAPMALDGFTQLFGLRESNWELRVVTGALFALSCVWVAFPYLGMAFQEMRRDLEARFARQRTELAVSNVEA